MNKKVSPGYLPPSLSILALEQKAEREECEQGNNNYADTHLEFDFRQNSPVGSACAQKSDF